MSTRSSYGSGAYVAGEGHVAIVPRGQASTTKRAVIFLHGWQGDATYALSLEDWSAQVALIRTILDAGYWVFSIDAGGPGAWANNTALTNIGLAKTWIQSNFAVPSGKVHVLGISMGGLTALAWANQNPTLAASCLSIIPVLDIEYVRANNVNSAAASIDSAYGGTYVDSTQKAVHNPSYFVTQAGAGILSVPTQLWYVTNDTYTPNSTYTSFASSYPTADINSLGALGHGNAAVNAIPNASVLNFLQAND